MLQELPPEVTSPKSPPNQPPEMCLLETMLPNKKSSTISLERGGLPCVTAERRGRTKRIVIIPTAPPPPTTPTQPPLASPHGQARSVAISSEWAMWHHEASQLSKMWPQNEKNNSINGSSHVPTPFTSTATVTGPRGNTLVGASDEGVTIAEGSRPSLSPLPGLTNNANSRKIHNKCNKQPSGRRHGT